MPDLKQIVINTGPLLALVAATGDLEILRNLFSEVWIPFEVQKEILSHGKLRFGVSAFNKADFLFKESNPITFSPILKNTLDKGEASVIQLALDKSISIVCIDEVAGRRVARLFNLELTGSLGIMIKAKKEGFPIKILDSIKKMEERGIYMSRDLIHQALILAGEISPGPEPMSLDLLNSLLE